MFLLCYINDNTWWHRIRIKINSTLSKCSELILEVKVCLSGWFVLFALKCRNHLITTGLFSVKIFPKSKAGEEEVLGEILTCAVNWRCGQWAAHKRSRSRSSKCYCGILHYRAIVHKTVTEQVPAPQISQNQREPCGHLSNTWQMLDDSN